MTRRDLKTISSRKRILDAATQCLVEGGYAAVTTMNVQDQAGVSRGHLLHHFHTRMALLTDLSAHVLDEYADVAATVCASAVGGADDRIARAINVMWLSYHHRHWWAVLETLVAARTSDQIGQVLISTDRRLSGLGRNAIDRIFGSELIARPRYEQTLELLAMSMRGVAVTYGFDRRDPNRDPHIQQWIDVTKPLLDAR